NRKYMLTQIYAYHIINKYIKIINFFPDEDHLRELNETLYKISENIIEYSLVKSINLDKSILNYYDMKSLLSKLNLDIKVNIGNIINLKDICIDNCKDKLND